MLDPNLLSGAIGAIVGALIGSAITVAVQVWLERVRRREQAIRFRSEVALATVEWLQDTWQSVSLLTTHKAIVHQHPDKPALLTTGEYRALRLDLRKRMLHDSLRARIAIVFGANSDQLLMVSAIQDGIREVIRAAWRTPEEWPVVESWIKERMTALDGTRNALEQGMIRICQPPERLWPRLRRRLEQAARRLHLWRTPGP